MGNWLVMMVARMPGDDNLDEIMVDLIGAKLARIGNVLDEDTDNIIQGSVQSQLHERMLAGARPGAALSPAPENETTAPALSFQPVAQNALAPLVPASAIVAKRGRGRPKVYPDKAAPTATERSKRSIRALADAGGKRVMLRLTREAYDALKVVMSLTGGAQETASINEAIIARKKELLRAST